MFIVHFLEGDVQMALVVKTELHEGPAVYFMKIFYHSPEAKMKMFQLYQSVRLSTYATVFIQVVRSQ